MSIHETVPQPHIEASSGVNYQNIDPFKVLAQTRAAETSVNIARFGFKVIESSRGESAFLVDIGSMIIGNVIEGLGTKNIIADQMRKITGKTYYDAIAQDDVAMIVNDLVSTGTLPVVVDMYAAAGRDAWFTDGKRNNDLTRGFKDACDKIGATWGGGESPALKDIVIKGKLDLAGSSWGVIQPKERHAHEEKLESGDRIVIFESSGPHANGVTGIRDDIGPHPQRWAARLEDGQMFGEAMLKPTHLYVKLVEDLFNAGVDIHYMQNITGHGWAKLMRSSRQLSYVIDEVPPVQPVFQFIQELRDKSPKEMYFSYNMGGGFAFYVPEKDVDVVQKIGAENHDMKSWNAGYVTEGSRQVDMKPLGFTFFSEELAVR